MIKERKQQVIDELNEALKEVKNLYFTDISGLNASETSNLRRFCFNEKIKLKVVKNTLLAKAMESSNHDFGDLLGTLKGNTSLMFSESGNAPAKIIKNFRKNSDKPILKGAFVEQAIYIGDSHIDTLASIKSKDEIIGDIISLLRSPIKNVVSSLQSGGGKLSGILKTLSEKNDS
ncbi:MAG: 50S ribosomal protein L10 [Bacteroidota bacterium]|nr:50S ribosomal protein L10 [Bacteroidota bacterium]